MLKKILQAREERWHTRCQLVEEYFEPVISITLNIPGSNKLKESYLQAHRVVVEDYLQNLKKSGMVVLYKKDRVSWDGPEVFFVVQGNGQKLKELSISFEESHPLGRLADIDILDKNKKNISRKDLNKPERKCFICGRLAHSCIIGKSHTHSELLEVIDKSIAKYLGII